MNILKRFIKSLCSFDSYEVFAKQAGYKAVIYIFVLSVILGSVAYVKPTMNINKLTKGMSQEIKVKLPEFTIKNGILDIKGDSPVVIELEKSTLILDDTGKNEGILNKKSTGIFFMKDSLVVKENGKIASNSKYPKLDLELTKAIVINQIIPLIDSFGIMYFVIMLGLFVLGSYLKVFILSIVGRFVVKENFGTRYKLSAYANTLPLILVVLMKVFKITFFGDSILLMAIALFYLHFASKAMKEKNYE